MSVAFRVQGREVRHTEPSYFEAKGYAVRITVSPDFRVETEVGIAQPGSSHATPIRSPSAS